MSIAVSAVIRRSGILQAALLAMAVFCLGIGAVISFDPGDAASLHQRLLAGACCVLAAAALMREIARPVASRRIDISGSGQIQVTDVPLREATGSRAFDAPQPDSPTYHLHVTSTLWSFLLVLDLRSESGTRLVLIVLPDTMTQASFRALCVACQWIAAHNIRANAEKS